MTKLVESIAKALVENPEHVVVTEQAEGQGNVLQLQPLSVAKHCPGLQPAL